MRRIVLAISASCVLIVGLAACGEDAARPGQTTVPRIGAPNYATLPPTPPTTTTSTLPPGETLPEGQAPAEGTSTYEIRGGDSLSKIAGRYDITINELCRLNDFDDCPQTLLIPGVDVVVPARAVVEEEEGPANDPLLGAPPTEDDACPDGSTRPTYEITTADTSQTRAARRAGVDLELLAWINRGNPVWTSFVPGTRLLLPCDDEELPENPFATVALDPESTVI